MKKLLVTLSAVALVSACAVTAEQGVMETQSRSGGVFGLTTNDQVTVQTPAAFKGIQKVVVGGFKVGFNDSKRLKNEAKKTFLDSGRGGVSTGLAKLEGVTSDAMQEITNRAYDDFVKVLQANGYEVVPRSQFTNHEGYKGTKEYQFPYKEDNSGFLSSYGTATFYSPKQIGNMQPIFMGDIDGVTGGFGFANPMNAVGKFGEATGIAVVNVSLFVDFAAAGGTSSFSGSTLKVGQLLSVDKGFIGIGSGYGSTFSTKVGSMSLGQAIGSKSEFAKVEMTSSDTNIVIETGLNTLSALAGMGTNQAREFVVSADESKYKEGASEVLSKAAESFVLKMVSLK